MTTNQESRYARTCALLPSTSDKRLGELRTKVAKWLIRFAAGRVRGFDKVASDQQRLLKLAQAIHQGKNIPKACQVICGLNKEAATKMARVIVTNGLRSKSGKIDKKAEKHTSRSRPTEKAAILDIAAAGLLGGGVGAVQAPSGSRGEGFARGVGRGAGLYGGGVLGAGLGGVGGAALGGAAGAGIGGLIGADPELISALTSAGLIGGGLAGGTAGALGGGYGGYKGMGALMGKPSWEGDEANTPDQPTEVAKAAMMGNAASSMSSSMPTAPSMSTTVPAAQAGAAMNKIGENKEAVMDPELQTALVGALAGGGLGAGTGALLAGKGNRLRGAAAGGLLGAGVGGLGGNAAAQQGHTVAPLGRPEPNWMEKFLKYQQGLDPAGLVESHPAAMWLR